MKEDDKERRKRMRAKQILVSALLATSLLGISGCGHIGSSSNNENAIDLEEASFSGDLFKKVLESLVKGMASTVGEDIMGNLLYLLGWGDPSDADQIKTIQSINAKLAQIKDELSTIETDLKEILVYIKVSEDSIKNDVDWPRDAITTIDTATQELQLMSQNTSPGEGNRTQIRNFSNDILGAQYDIPNQVMSIYDAIRGNPTPLLSNYIDQVLLQTPKGDDNLLKKAYLGFEYYTSQLLDYQVKGVNLVTEAYKALDENSSAQRYLDCYDGKITTSECAIVTHEVADLNDSSSFISNTIRLTLANASLYDTPFLGKSSFAILKRADFYRHVTSQPDKDDFGLDILGIHTSDILPPEDVPQNIDLSIWDKNNELIATTKCPLMENLQIQGPVYDKWNMANTEDPSVQGSDRYTLVHYHCKESFTFYTYSYNLAGKHYAGVTIDQYDPNYHINDLNGSITYGFSLAFNRQSDHFQQRSDNWHTQVPSADNYGNNDHQIHLPDSWSIVTKAMSDANEDTAKSRVELDGFFTYNGNSEQNVTIDYSIEFYHHAHAEPYECGVDPSYGPVMCGSGSKSAYYVGVYDRTTHNILISGTTKVFNVECPDNSSADSEATITEKSKMTFKAVPGHQYYIFINLVSSVPNPSDDASGTWAMTNLNKVNYIYLRFDQ